MSIKKIIIFCAALGLAVSANAARQRHNAQNNKEPAQATMVASQPVDINTADEAALEQIKGIGPKKAAAIVAYRNEHGRFQSVEDLTNVKGIGEKRLAKIKSYVVVK